MKKQPTDTDHSKLLVHHFKELLKEKSSEMAEKFNEIKQQIPTDLGKIETLIEKYNVNPTELKNLSREFLLEHYQKAQTLLQELKQEQLQNQLKEEKLIKLKIKYLELENKHLAFLKTIEQSKSEYYKQQFELRALHGQIDPHFLNNTLSCIHALVSTSPDKAQLYLAKLTNLFQETRKNASQNTITIEQELTQVQNYIELQKLRFQDKIHFEINVPENIFEYSLPPYSLQILVENALTHARMNLSHSLSIVIIGKETEQEIILQVQDNGCGIPPERLILLTRQVVDSKAGSGTALYYLQQILWNEFHKQATLKIESCVQSGTTMTIALPKELSV